MRIGELADHGSVSAKTVRYYESIGLLKEPLRTASGYRDYDAAAVERLCFIRDAQASGLTLAEIASVLELKQTANGPVPTPANYYSDTWSRSTNR